MLNPILRISDGTTTTNLLDLHGWTLDDWKPAVPESKGGGVFRDSPLVDGRKLAYRKMDNVIDTFNLIGSKESQNQMITSIQELERLLEKAISYWTSNWQNQPVWIEARAANETTSRYATIVDYRLTGFGGPYRQPFFASDCSSATEAILVIEHMYWQETIPGEDGVCARLHNEKDYPDVTKLYNGDYYPNVSGHDGTYSTGEASVDLSEAFLSIGNSPSYAGASRAGIIFDNVTIPVGATIIQAALQLFDRNPSLLPSITFLIWGQLDPASVFSGTNADFLSRTKTISYVVQPIQQSSNIPKIDVTDIVKEIVADPSWVIGSDLGIFISTVGGISGSTRDIVSIDAGASLSKLTIDWSTESIPMGRGLTCESEVFVTNKYNTAPVNFIYCVRGGVFSPNLYGQDYSSPIPLFQDAGGAVQTPVAGDILYFGSCQAVTGDTNYGVFCSLVFDLSTIQSGINGHWEKYISPGVWHDFDVSGNWTNELCGDQSSFTTLGVGSIVWELTDDWIVLMLPNGRAGYWIRFVVTSVVGVPISPYQDNRDIYTILFPYVDIDSTEVPGDIPALARIVFDSAACAARSMNTLVLGLRSLSRGEDFCAYLNASDVQNPTGVSFNIENPLGGTVPALYNDTSAPTGKVLRLITLDPNAHNYLTFLPICNWSMSGSLASQYTGTYHAYVRCWFSSGAVGSMKLRLRAVFGEEYNVSYSDVSSVTLGGYLCAVDLGQFSILPSTWEKYGETVNIIKICLETLTDDDSDYTLGYIYDIVLIPTDEWAGNFGIPKITGTSVLEYGQYLDIDGITTPRQYRAAQMESGNVITALWSRIASSVPMFQANTDQRLWFFQYKQQNGLASYFEDSGSVRSERSARYLLARGSR